MTWEALALDLNGFGGDQIVYLNWSINTSLPATSTWTIDYAGPPGDQIPPITGIPEPARAYTLTELNNYEWYTITLSAMLDSTAWLSDTVRVIPAGMFAYLPLVLKDQ